MAEFTSGEAVALAQAIQNVAQAQHTVSILLFSAFIGAGILRRGSAVDIVRALSREQDGEYTRTILERLAVDIERLSDGPPPEGAPSHLRVIDGGRDHAA